MILCADDFGISPSVSESIVELIEENRITATSCMVVWPDVETEMARLRPIKTQYDLELHVVLTEAKPLTNLKKETGLVDAHGDFLSFRKLLKKAYCGGLIFESVLAEIEAQIQRFMEITGREPDYIDGHQHVQQLPIVRDAVKEAIVKRKGTRPIYVRVAGLPFAWYCLLGRSCPLNFSVRNMLVHFPGHFTRKLMTKSGIPHNRYLLGNYEYEGGEKFEEVFRRYLTLKPGEKDIFYCHPGRADEVLKRRDSAIHSREEALTFLRSPLFVEIMEESGVHLNTFF